MKLLIALCLVAVATAAPSYSDVEIVRYENDNIGVGKYRFAVEQNDGTKQEQFGELKKVDQVGQAVAVTGSYSWWAPEGINYLVKYVADENGYKSNIEKIGFRGYKVL